MLQYELAGLRLVLNHKKERHFKGLRSFAQNSGLKPDIEVKFQLSGSFGAPNFFVSKEDWISWHLETTENHIFAQVYLKDTGKIEYQLEISPDWSDITVFYSKSSRSPEKAFCEYLGNFLFSNKIILHAGIVLHASSIEHNGKGIAFTAPSGTGKSTHTAMWEKYYKATVLNDDCPVLKYENGQSFIYGTPWSGKNNKACNRKSPLNALVFIEQALDNSIRQVSDEEGLPLLLPRLHLPYQNPLLMDNALRNIEFIFRNIPKYLLRCKPDRDAVELVMQCLG
jgi:hypothetical protein